MPYALTIATPATRTLVVEAMRGRADTLKRAATVAAAAVEVDRAAGRDVRSRSVRLVTMLAQASDLEGLATELEGAEELALVERAPGLALVPIPEPDVAPEVLDELLDDAVTAASDDGLSAEAHALADAAGLTETVLEDELGNALEDEPEPDDVVDVTALALTDAPE